MAKEYKEFEKANISQQYANYQKSTENTTDDRSLVKYRKYHSLHVPLHSFLPQKYHSGGSFLHRF